MRLCRRSTCSIRPARFPAYGMAGQRSTSHSWSSTVHLLFSWSGSKGTSFGPCFWHGPEGVLNQHIFRVIPSDGVQQRFLGYALEYVTVLIERKAHGSAGLVHVTKKELEQYKINIPTPHVQKKIAAVLDIAEAEVSQLNRRVAAVKQQRTCLMRQLLTGKVRVNLNADTAKG